MKVKLISNRRFWGKQQSDFLIHKVSNNTMFVYFSQTLWKYPTCSKRWGGGDDWYVLEIRMCFPLLTNWSRTCVLSSQSPMDSITRLQRWKTSQWCDFLKSLLEMIFKYVTSFLFFQIHTVCWILTVTLILGRNNDTYRTIQWYTFHVFGLMIITVRWSNAETKN